MRTKIFMLLVSLFAFNLLGCTRAAKDEAKLSLSLASSVDGQGALGAATLQLAHVSINVTGAGMAAPVVYTWDGCRDCSVQTIIPSNFQVTVPSGTGRLIQILAVYEDSETNQKVFYYGDMSKDLNVGDVAAEIPVTSVGQGTITGGRVAGRYFNTATGGPTGLIDIKYSPGGGKPALIVDNAIIVNGWFSMFMLSGANLKYTVRDTNEVLWGQEMSFESAPMDPAENSGAFFNQRVRASLPVHITQRSDYGVTTYHKQDAETYVWGYWGPGATGKRVCTSGLDSSPVPQRLKQYTAANPESAAALNVSHYINWNLAGPTKAQLTDTTTPYGYVVFQGGVSMSSGCDSFADTFTNQFSNFLKVGLNQIDGNGGDSVAGFTGIFRNNSNNGFASASGADPKVITGELLPGVEEVFNGLRLFKRVASDDFRLEVPRCHELAAQGFVPGSTSDAVLTSSGTFSLASNITAAEGSNGVSAVLCPVKSGTLAPLGIFMSKWNFNMGGGGGGGMGLATKLALVTPQKTSGVGAVANNVCTPLMLEAHTASDTPGYLPNMTTVNLSSTDGNTEFHSFVGCTSAVTSIQMSGPSGVMVFVKRTVSGAGSSVLNASASGLASSTATVSFSDAPASGSFIPKIKVNFPSTISAHECYPITFESWHDNQFMASFNTVYGTDVMLNLATGTGMNYYSMGSCPSSSATTAVLGTSVSSLLHFKYTGSATSLNMQPTSLSTSAPVTISDIVGGNSVTVIQPGAVSNMDLMVPLNFEEGVCQSISIRSTDNMGRTSPTSSPVTINLATDLAGAQFYDAMNCFTQVSTITFPAGSTSTLVYYKATSTGPATLTASSAAPSFSVTRNANLLPPTYSQLKIVLPGQTFTGGVVTGTPTPLQYNVAANFTIYLVRYDGQIDTTANGNLLTFASANNAVMSAYGMVNFVNGVGTATVTPDSSGFSVNLNISAGMAYGTETVSTAP